MSVKNQSASGKALCFPPGIPLRADRLSKKDIARGEAVDVVAQARATESVGCKPSEPLDLSMGRFSSGPEEKGSAVFVSGVVDPRAVLQSQLGVRFSRQRTPARVPSRRSAVMI
jgi:hypothetical protein